MCGRYAASASVEEIVETFDVAEVPEELPGPRFNIAPTDTVAAVVERTGRDDDAVTRKLVGLRWGLVPSWSKAIRSSATMINARAETVATKPAFRRAFAARRCLIPADGYYEWYPTQRTNARGKPLKQPFFIHREAGLFVMAGIYEFWRAPDERWVSSCSIITTQATDALGTIHDRMPMTVARADWGMWLDPAVTDPDVAHRLLATPHDMTAYAVSTLVSNVRNDGPELLEAVATEPV